MGNWFQTLSEKAVLHDKLQLKISVFFLFCYFLYQKLCLRFLVWNKVKKLVKTRHVSMKWTLDLDGS